ncbi:MAG: ABC transporter ATP-binding protein [candidate division Zixibacteria bacterium]|nr:ABC transporter ATP-binding protein [candidate division Zixibacteria bacterium]
MAELGDTISGGVAATVPVARALGVCRHFDTPDGRLDILRGIDLTVNPGEMIAIVGASGVGKSTFLHILGGLDAPSAGEVYWGGDSPFAWNDEQRSRARNRSVGFVFQFHHLLPEFTAEENVALPMIIGGRSHSEASKRAHSLLESVGLGARARHMPGELSGGEQQRAAVARALANGAQLLIADEPSGNLDRRTAEQLHDLLGNIIGDKKHAIVVATHNPDLSGRANRTYSLRDGRLHPSGGELGLPASGGGP